MTLLTLNIVIRLVASVKHDSVRDRPPRHINTFKIHNIRIGSSDETKQRFGLHGVPVAFEPGAYRPLILSLSLSLGR